MKNFIKQNYNLYPSKIYKNKNCYFFFSNNEKILIFEVKKEIKNIDELVKISNNLYFNGIKVATFLLNKDNKYYTKKDDNYIVLLKCNDIKSNDINIKEIKKYILNNNIIINKLDIIKKMENTIDTLENEMTEYNKEYPIIQDSLNYFIGMSENAIQMLKGIKFSEEYLGHALNVDSFNIEELNNPLNFVMCNKMHDICLYFKYRFYKEYIDYEELYSVIKDKNNTKEELIYFFCEMLYQGEYFNEVKNVLLNKKEEKILFIYINKINEYKKLLKYIKDNLHNISEIMELQWIDN